MGINVSATIPRYVYDAILADRAYVSLMDDERATLLIAESAYSLSRDLLESILMGEYFLSSLSEEEAQIDYFCPSCQDKSDWSGIDISKVYEYMLNDSIENEDYEQAARIRDLINDEKQTDG